MRRYPEYKASGLEWVGEIPEHWKMQRAKFIFRRLQRPIREHDEIITAFRDGIVTLRKNRRTLGFTNSLKEIGYQGLRKGDLVIHAMDGHAGAIGVSDSDGKSSPVYSVCRPISQENVYYYAYLLRYMALSGFIESLAKGIRERSTEFRFNEFKELDLLIPPVFEQTQIANFLDNKTGKIDELIRIKGRRIELLQEQRTTLINQAVTKGLDPNVEMKLSGVEWLGEIPAHWEVLKVKHVGSSNPSKNNPKTDRLKDKLVVFLPMERVHTDGTIDQELRHPYSQLKNGYTYFEENDILIAKVTPCFENGKIVLIKNLATPIGFGSTEFIVIRPNPQKVFTPFLYYILYNAPLRHIGKHFMTRFC